jgi:hypothetical protein
MHQTADTSFPARRGLGFGLRLVRAVDFGIARLDWMVERRWVRLLFSSGTSWLWPSLRSS